MKIKLVTALSLLSESMPFPRISRLIDKISLRSTVCDIIVHSLPFILLPIFWSSFNKIRVSLCCSALNREGLLFGSHCGVYQQKECGENGASTYAFLPFSHSLRRQWRQWVEPIYDGCNHIDSNRQKSTAKKLLERDSRGCWLPPHSWLRFPWPTFTLHQRHCWRCHPCSMIVGFGFLAFRQRINRGRALTKVWREHQLRFRNRRVIVVISRPFFKRGFARLLDGQHSQLGVLHNSSLHVTVWSS